MANGDTPSLSKLCALHFASIIGNGRVPPIDIPLPSHVGNDILKAMHQHSLLNEKSFDTFTKTPLGITKLDSSGTDVFTIASLTALQKYKGLVSVNITAYDRKDATPFKSLNFDQFVTLCLSEESHVSLRHLNVAGPSRIFRTDGFEKLKFLESLCLARRPIDSKLIHYTVNFLPATLTCLDISDTKITDLEWIEKLPNLEAFIMHNVPIQKGDTKESLLCLKNLRVLDISKKTLDYPLSLFRGDPIIDISIVFMDTLKESVTPPWPYLKKVDMSGNALAEFGMDQAIEVVETVIEKCPEIVCISVLATPLDTHTFYDEVTKNVQIINCGTRRSALDALEHYALTERDAYTSHALHAVYYCLQSSYEEFSPKEIVRCAGLVCNAMKRHLLNIGVQMAGSACLYHLCKMKRIRRLSSAIVQDCMNRCLDAAEHWRSMVQLQKNVWLTICNDYLLQLPGVDFYRTCKVALESMLTSKDSSVARMTIAIVSIVTPKMRPPEARELTGDDRYVKFLVEMLNENIRHADSTPGPRPETSLFTLKFTLSALWNLTDESSKTCEVFHKSGGIETCFILLKKFDDHYNIQTKVLGILNNIAEVEELRVLLASNNDYIKTLCSCLGGDFSKCEDNGRNRVVERSYFAAGVLANLSACSSISNEENKETVIEVDSCLYAAVSKWPQLQGAMVSYRSFSPFERILEGTSSDGARMWCLWGILHVISNKEKPNGLPYPKMLTESTIPEHCERLIHCGDVVIHGLAEQILSLAQQDFYSDSSS